MRRRRDYYGEDVKVYKTEAEMCADFISGLKDSDWTPYPECCGWDILLVHNDQRQIGIEAKLRANFEVLVQVVEKFPSHEWDTHRTGPDICAVLVPDYPNGFHRIAYALQIVVLQPEKSGGGDFATYFPKWPSRFSKRHELPKYVPDVVAGRPCPIQLTPWKIQAIHLCRVLRSRGHLTKEDFKKFGVDRRRWLNGPKRWLDAVDGRYVAIPGRRLPDEDHPVVSAQIDRELGFTKVQG